MAGNGSDRIGFKMNKLIEGLAVSNLAHYFPNSLNLITLVMASVPFAHFARTYYFFFYVSF